MRPSQIARRLTVRRRPPLPLPVLPAALSALCLLVGTALPGAARAAATTGPVRAAAPGAAAAAPSSVTLVGSLQSELSCAQDWDPACAATHLVAVPGTARWEAVLTVPAGGYEYKVALDDSWAENYGADGVAGGANIPLVVAGAVALRFGYDAGTHRISVAPTDLPGGAVSAADRALAARSPRAGATRERFYFVMTDRFANGSTANDTGGLSGDRMSTGYDPTDKGFYHGGDLKGLIGKLDYIKGLGTTAIWLTPSFVNQVVQGSGSAASAGYHGYWVTDFTRIDPHLGTNADLKALIAQAHRRGMKVYFDIITNHTGDIIDYAQGRYDYVPRAQAPYRDAAGNAFDPAQYAGGNTFPVLDAATSFPYTPVFRSAADATVKVPAWLNDPTHYHNRGNSTFAGESALDGDFYGLDDLFTEQPDVVHGMEDIYSAWVDFGVDGFRIDTVKHVNTEFWQQFIPTIRARAAADGKPDFFAFGEVYDPDPRATSFYDTSAGLQATLDFPFQARAVDFADGRATSGLRDLYAADDWYTDTDGNAYGLPTFLGNHDMGRIGHFISAHTGATGTELLARDRLAHALEYLTRGQPVVYYGDEQGFTGDGGDQDAREDSFASAVASYNDNTLIGTAATTAQDNFDPAHPMYRWIAALAALRRAHPALADGTQVHRYSSSEAGIYAFSRLDAARHVEYVVALNNATTTATAAFDTYSPGSRFRPVFGPATAVRADGYGRVRVSVPALSAVVWKAERPIPRRAHAPALYWATPSAGGTLHPLAAGTPGAGRVTLRVAVPENAAAEVSFGWRVAGAGSWTRLGTDDNAPYRVMPDASGLAPGTVVELRAVLRDSAGNYAAASGSGVIGEPGTGGGGGAPPEPVVQPGAVSVPGDHNTEMGCAGDWQPDCVQAQLGLDANDQVWKGTYTLPVGDYQYKVAMDGSWEENYGAGAVPDGANIGYTAPSGPVTFYYDHATHWVTTDTQGPIVTAPGSFQGELGCSGDWDPACMRPWLEDPDGDGVYTFVTAAIPAGSYEVKVAHGLSWNENYGAGGIAGGANIPFTVPADGAVTTFSYALGTHLLSVISSRPGAMPDLSTVTAHWVARDLIAWPSDRVPAGVELVTLRWRLHWSASAGLGLDEEAVTGGTSAPLRWDPAGLPAAVTAAHPALAGYLALRPDRRTARRAPAIVAGQVAVAQYDDLGLLLDASGVDPSGVLDELGGHASRANPLAVGRGRGAGAGGSVHGGLWPGAF